MFAYLNLWGHNKGINHECEGRIEKSVHMIAVWHHEACRVMTNGDPEGQIFFLPPPERRTLNGTLQEYESHFSGIWGHFLECLIFRHKSTKCTHTRFL